MDLDEIRPDRFIIKNDKVRPLLKGEGVTAGKFFELVTWRREGLIARIRERGFNVRTIEDRITMLAAIENVSPPGNVGLRVLSQAKERIASFERATLRWVELPIIEHNRQAAVQIRDNEPVRRRKGRGSGDYYITSLTPSGQLNLLPVAETTALIHAYSQIAVSDQPVNLPMISQADLYLVPQQQAILPQRHRETLLTLALDKATPWTFPQKIMPMAEAVFAKLGITLQPAS